MAQKKSFMISYIMAARLLNGGNIIPIREGKNNFLHKIFYMAGKF